MNQKSFVHFKDGAVKNGTNDGMKLLGYFLLEQVGAKISFFEDWLSPRHVTALPIEDNIISSKSYLLEKKDDDVILSHLSSEHLTPFQTSAEQFMLILAEWQGLCKSHAHSACKVGGHDVILFRDLDNDTFSFKTQTS